MELSESQMQAVMHGIDTNANQRWWCEWELPKVAAKDIPSWMHAFHVDWNERYSNFPSYKILADDDVHEWPNQVWDYVGKDPGRGYYITKSDDGRASAHYAASPRLAPLTEGGKAVWTTPQEEGYGGRHFHIKMSDGRDMVLRGPWHSGPPRGFVEVHYDTLAHVERTQRGARENYEWWQLGGYFGLMITSDLFKKLLAHYRPDLKLALVRRGSFLRLEPYPFPYPDAAQNRDGEEGAPKHMKMSEKVIIDDVKHQIDPTS